MVKKAQTAELSVEEQAIAYTDSLVEKALAAETLYATYSQEQVDKIVAAMALAGSPVGGRPVDAMAVCRVAG